MSLTDLIRNLKESARPGIAPKVDRWLMGRDSYVTEIEGVLHPSSIPSVDSICPRAIFFDLFTPIERYPKDLLSKSFDPRVYRIFDNGHHVHRRWQAYFIEMGICDPRVRVGWEIPIKAYEEFLIKGHADVIVYPEAENTVQLVRAGLANGEFAISTEDGGLEYRCRDPKPLTKALASEYKMKAGDHIWINKQTDLYFCEKNPKERRWWQPKGAPMLVEIKSIYEYGFNLLIGPLGHHLMQATIYAGWLRDTLYPDLKEIAFIYENKNSQEVKEYIVPLDLDKWAFIKNMMRGIQRDKQRGKLPDRICKSAVIDRAQSCDWCGPCFTVNTYTELVGIHGTAKTTRHKTTATKKARK